MSHAAFTIRELPDGGANLSGMETGLQTGSGKKAEEHLFSGIYGEINNPPGFHPKTGGTIYSCGSPPT